MYNYLFLAVFSAYYLNCSAAEVTPPAEPPKVQESGAAVLKPGQPPMQPPKEVTSEAAEPAKTAPPSPPSPKVEEKPAQSSDAVSVIRES